MATGVVTWSQTAASNATADSSVNWAEGMAPSAVNDSARAMMASVAKWRDDTNGSITTGGTSTAFTVTSNQNFASLSALANQEIAFTMHTTSGATPTLSVDGLTAKVIRAATGVALATGALLSGSVYRVKYDTTVGEFLLVNQSGVIPSGSVATASIADDAVTFAKIQDLAQNTFIGRYTASTGDPQALTLSTGLTVNSSTGNVTTTTNPSLFPGFLSGLELSTAGSSATFGIAVGAANDTTNATLMALTSAYTKTTSAWAVGTGNGALDTGTIANSTWYHVWLIARSDTGVVDVLISTSVSSPTMPSSYDRKRRIGAMKTNGSGQWTKFTQTHDTFIWDTVVNDLSAGTATSRTNVTMTVPTGVVVEALFRAAITLGAGNAATIFTSLQESDQAPVSGRLSDLSTASNSAGSFERLTDTSARIGYRNESGSLSTYIYTYGWRDFRGK